MKLRSLFKRDTESWSHFGLRVQQGIGCRVRWFLRQEHESWSRYEFRMRYAVLRWVHPKWREDYHLSRLAGPLGCWDQLVQYQMNILLAHSIKPGKSVLDIGCGPLTVGIPLIQFLDRGNYVGIDRRPEALAMGYRRIAEAALVHKNPLLIQSETFGHEELADRRFDFIWMSQLSYHLDDAQMSKLFNEAHARLEEDGLFLLDAIDPAIVQKPGATWRGFRFYIRPLNVFQDLAHKHRLSLKHLGHIRDYGYPQHINELRSNHLLGLRRFQSNG
jgi:SAM-dependent methyltransferase